MRNVAQKPSERIYFMPNQDREWLDFVYNQTCKLINHPRNRISILVIGGVFYGSYLAAKGAKITVVEKNSTAVLFQTYLSRLISKQLKSHEIKKKILLGKFKTENRSHSLNAVCSKPEYNSAVRELSQELGLKSYEAEAVFDKIFNSCALKDKVRIKIPPKGFNIDSFIGQKFEMPDKIITSDLLKLDSHKLRYDLIISNNVVDFFDKPGVFLDAIEQFTHNKSLVEVTTYKNTTSKYLEVRFPSGSKRNVGVAYIAMKIKDNYFRQFQKQLTLGKDVFLIKGEKLIFERRVPQIPYWIKHITASRGLPQKIKLFTSKDSYIICEAGRFSRITI